MEEHTEDARVAEENARTPVSIAAYQILLASLKYAFLQVKIAIWASLIANFCLCILQRR